MFQINVLGLELLRWIVSLDFPTVLTKDKIYEYLVKMSDMSYGLTREIVMHLAYTVAEKLHKNHPFDGVSAGWTWFEGLTIHYSKLTLPTIHMCDEPELKLVYV